MNEIYIKLTEEEIKLILNGLNGNLYEISSKFEFNNEIKDRLEKELNSFKRD